MFRKLIPGIAVAALSMSDASIAVTTDGYGSIVTVPIIAQTATYASQIFIHVPPGNAYVNATVQPIYYGANGSATVGTVVCPSVVITAGHTNQYSLSTLCALNPGSNFGRLYFREVNSDNRPFAVYTRVETFSGNGFSVEGFPIGNFQNSGPNDAGASFVTGLKRQAAAPGYQTNCFLAALGEAVTVNTALLDNTGATIGTAFNTTLGANEVVRFLDIFGPNGVNAAAGDYSNVTAKFFENGANEPAFAAFCTVQNNSSFDADFRVAKVQNPTDLRADRFVSVSTDALGNAFQVTDVNLKNIHVAYVHQPDWISCSLTGANTAQLEFQMKDPAGTVVAGGNAITTFAEFYTGEHSAIAGGVAARWRIEVSSNSVFNPTPIAYGISCTSGNGMTQLDFIGTAGDDF
jgi:hypothetical protein